MYKNKLIKHHYIRNLDMKEKMFLATIIGCSFVRGMMIGLYLNEK